MNQPDGDLKKKKNDSELRLAPVSLQTKEWADILIVSTGQGKLTVRIANKEVVSAQAVYKNDDFKEYYIGGAPYDLRQR